MCTPAVAPGQWLDLHRQQLAEALAHQRAQEAARAQRLQQQQRLRQQAQLQPPSSHLDPASDWHPYITRQRSQEPPVSAAGRGRQPAGFWDALAHGAPSMGSQQPRARATHPVQGRPSSGDQWWPQAAAAGAQPDHHRPQEQAWAELLPPRWGWPWQQAPEQHVPAPAPAPATRQHQGRQAPSAGNGIELVWVESDGEDGGDVEVSSCSVQKVCQPSAPLRSASACLLLGLFQVLPPLFVRRPDDAVLARCVEDSLLPWGSRLAYHPFPPVTMAPPHSALRWLGPAIPAAGGKA